MLEADGVRVVIPAGALTSPMKLELSVTTDDGPTITVSPSVIFAKPVEVIVEGTLWPAARQGHASRLHADGSHHVAFLSESGDGVTFETPGFSSIALRASSEGTGSCFEDPRAWCPGSRLGEAHDLPSAIPFHGADGTQLRASLEACLSDVALWAAGADSTSLLEPKPGSTAEKATFDIQGKNGIYEKTHHCGPGACADHLCTEGREDAEKFQTTPLLAGAMADLSSKLQTDYPGYQLWINGAYDSSGCVHSTRSNHYGGSAIDLDLYKDGTKVANEGEELGVLAALTHEVLSQVAADNGAKVFVFYEHDHVHAELTKPDACPLPPSKSDPDQLTATVDGEGSWTTDLVFGQTNGFGNLIVYSAHELAEGTRELELWLPNRDVNGSFQANDLIGEQAVDIRLRYEGSSDEWSCSRAPDMVQGTVQFHQDPEPDKTFDSIVWGLFDGTLYNDSGESITIEGAFKVQEVYFEAL